MEIDVINLIKELEKLVELGYGRYRVEVLCECGYVGSSIVYGARLSKFGTIILTSDDDKDSSSDEYGKILLDEFGSIIKE